MAVIVSVVKELLRALLKVGFKGAIKKLGELISARRFTKNYLNNVYEENKYVRLQQLYAHLPAGLGLELENLYLEPKSAPLPITMPRTSEGLGLIQLRRYTCRPVLDALRRNKKVVVIGRPGAGKSILVRYIALKCALEFIGGHEQQKYLLGKMLFPIVVRLREVVRRGGNLSVRNLSQLCVPANFLHDCPEEFFRIRLEKGDCIVMFDGIDDVPANTRQNIAEQICALARNFPQNRFVITSRPPLIGVTVPEFAEYCLCDLTEDEVEALVYRLHLATELAIEKIEIPISTPRIDTAKRKAKQDTDEFIRAIEGAHAGVHRLTRTPLLLILIAMVHWKQKALPSQPEVLYKACVDLLLIGWQGARGVSTWITKGAEPADAENQRRVLEDLAYWMQVGGVHEVSESRLVGHHGPVAISLDKVGGRREDAKEFLQYMQQTIGLLTQPELGIYGFSHGIFQDFMVASYLVRKAKDGRSKLLRRLHDPEWFDVVLLYAGMGDTAKLISAILSQPEDLFKNNLSLAARCLERAIKIDQEVKEEVLSPLIEELRNGEFKGLRDRAQEVLIRLGEGRYADSVKEKLEPLLKSENAGVRMRTALMLFKLGDTGAKVIGVLTRLLSQWGQDEVRQSIAFELGSFARTHYQETKNKLMSLLNDKDEEIRGGATLAFGWLGRTDNEIIEALLRRLQDDESPRVRRRAVCSLEWLGCAQQWVIDALVESLEDEATEVCAEAAFALGELGRLDNSQLSRLGDLFSDGLDPEVLGRAASTLGRLGCTEDWAIDALVRLLNNKEGEVRARAATALGDLGATDPIVSADSRVVPGLVGLLIEFEQPEVKGRAAAALASLGSISPTVCKNSDVIEALVKLLNDQDLGVRGRATSALSWLERTGPRDLRTEFLRWLDSPDENVRGHAAAALGRLRHADENVIRALVELLDDKIPGVCGHAASALGLLGQADQMVVKALLKSLEERSAEVRRRAAIALGQLGRGEPAIINALVKLLDDVDSKVRWNAAFALGELGWIESEASRVPPKVRGHAAEALLKSLDDDDAQVRGYGASALGRLGYSKRWVFKALVRLLSDKDTEVRSRAASALSELESRQPEGIEHVVGFLSDQEKRTARYAAMALFIMLRASKQGIHQILHGEDISKLRGLLADEAEIWQPVLDIRIRVKDVAWWLLQEFSHAANVKIEPYTLESPSPSSGPSEGKRAA